MDYPIKLRSNKKFISELSEAEEGRYEDALRVRETGSEKDIQDNGYDCVLNDFIDRHQTVIEVRNDSELCELYYALASGLIGIYGHAVAANNMLDKIRPRVREINPDLVRSWPHQNGF